MTALSELAGLARAGARRAQRWLGRPPTVPPGASRFADRDALRLRLAAELVRGRGAEIGPGKHPALLPDGVECHYFDKRSPEKVRRSMAARAIPADRIHRMEDGPEVFPDGADFVLAHNVLEHVVDPIGSLLEWHRFARDGGVMVLSVPEAGHGPDVHRLPVTLEHILLDHLLERDGRSFETREHVFAGLSGFDKGEFRGIGKRAIAARSLALATAEDVAASDVFWHVHVFTPDVFEQTVEIAAALDGRRVEPLRLASAGHADPSLRTGGEIVFVYRLHAGESGRRQVAPSLRALGDRLREALRRLERLAPEA